MDTILFPLQEYWWIYTTFIAFVGVMLALDLGVFHKKAHAIGFKEAAGWSVFWVSLSLVINFIFYLYAQHKFSSDPNFALTGLDPDATAKRMGLEFLTGFVIEKALAIDNIFLFVLVFSALSIPAKYQHRVLFFGILGALFFRAIFIALGAKLMAYHWVVVLFGVFLIFTGIKMLIIAGQTPDLENNKLLKFLKKRLPMTDKVEGEKFFVRKNGILLATPLFLALCLLELSDIIFAIDSVPAIFAITKEPMIVFISNILAILGLRSMYFMLSGVMDRFYYLKYGLSFVLIFVGLKMAWLNEVYGGKFPIGVSLSIIAALIFGSVFLSLLKTRRSSHKHPHHDTQPKTEIT